MRFTRAEDRVLALALVLGATTAGFDWPQFRGPNAAGVAHESNLPVVFGPEENVVFRTELPGGPSSPSIAGGRIFLTAAEEGISAVLRRFAAASNRATHPTNVARPFLSCSPPNIHPRPIVPVKIPV